MANRSPAGPTFIGSTTLRTAAVATAASIALPPRLNTSTPAWTASGWLLATMPLRAITSERRCDSQPSARSPGTALHQEGVGFESHDWTGDCARGATACASNATSDATRVSQPLLMPSVLDLVKEGGQHAVELLRLLHHHEMSGAGNLRHLGVRQHFLHDLRIGHLCCAGVH